MRAVISHNYIERHIYKTLFVLLKNTFHYRIHGYLKHIRKCVGRVTIL